MALTTSLLPGYQYKVARGPYKGDIVTIIDPKAFPDGHPHQRKITVMFDGEVSFILPRLLDNVPVGVGNVDTSALAAATTVTQTIAPKEMPGHVVVNQVAPVVPLRMARTPKPITDPMDPRLDHLRPSVSKCKRYVSRIMPNGKTDVETLLAYTTDAYRSENQGRPANLALKGDTQSGKTFLVEVLAVQWAEAMGYPKPMPIFTLSGSAGVTDFDLFGQTTSYTDPITGVESLVWLPGTVEMAAQCGGILYGDEINAIDERFTTSLFSVADHRHAFTNRNKAVDKGGQLMPEVTSTHLDMWFIITYNEGYAGMTKMNQALHQRFDHLLWDYDPAVEAKLVRSATILEIGKAFRLARKARTISTPIGTAVLQRFQRNVEVQGVAMAVETFLGMFEMRERDLATDIFKERSFTTSLIEEEKAAKAATQSPTV
jgi:MoxR-like ATPase